MIETNFDEELSPAYVGGHADEVDSEEYKGKAETVIAASVYKQTGV